MEAMSITQEIMSLPPEAQRQVIDFVAFLRSRYPPAPTDKKIERPRLADEPFIGMWRGREDMQDSTTWVSSLRQKNSG